MVILRRKNVIFFLFFAQNIDRGYTLEPPHWGGFNEYQQSTFYSKKKKGNDVHTGNPSFPI